MLNDVDFAQSTYMMHHIDYLYNNLRFNNLTQLFDYLSYGALQVLRDAYHSAGTGDMFSQIRMWGEIDAYIYRRGLNN